MDQHLPYSKFKNCVRFQTLKTIFPGKTAEGPKSTISIDGHSLVQLHNSNGYSGIPLKSFSHNCAQLLRFRCYRNGRQSETMKHRLSIGMLKFLA